MLRLNHEELFEPDYFEDLENLECVVETNLEPSSRKVTLKGRQQIVIETLTGKPPYLGVHNGQVYNTRCKSSESGSLLHDRSDAGKTSINGGNRSAGDFQMTAIKIEDDTLEGDGVFNEEVHCIEPCQRFPQNGRKRISSEATIGTDVKELFEENYEVALKNKEWNVLENISRDSFSDDYSKERLCFLCADSLTSPAEFLGMVEYYDRKPGKHALRDELALIGGKLMVNADMCQNFKAAVLILRIMVDSKIWYHYLTIKTFHVTCITKSAVQSCLKEKNYDLLSTLMTKSEFLGANEKTKKYINYTLIENLVITFQQIISYLGSEHGTDSGNQQLSKLATLSLRILEISNDARRCSDGGRKYLNAFKSFNGISDKVFILFKIFISEKMLREVESLIMMSSQFKDLITWNYGHYRVVISFFLNCRHGINRVYWSAREFVNILNHQQILPPFEEYSRENSDNVLTICTYMDENEVRLYLSLFCISASNQRAKGCRVQRWNISVVKSERAVGDEGRACVILERILCRYFTYLKWTKLQLTYSVLQYVNDVKNDARSPVVKNSMNYKNFVESSVDRDANKISKRGTSAPSIAHPLLVPKCFDDDGKPPSKKFQPDRNDNLKVVANHPRFVGAFKTLDTSRGSRTEDLRSVRQGDAPVYLRLVADVNSRLRFYVKNGQLQNTAVARIAEGLSERLFGSLPRDANGRAVYDDDAFERIHAFMNGSVQKRFFM